MGWHITNIEDRTETNEKPALTCHSRSKPVSYVGLTGFEAGESRSPDFSPDLTKWHLTCTYMVERVLTATDRNRHRQTSFVAVSWQTSYRRTAGSSSWPFGWGTANGLREVAHHAHSTLANGSDHVAPPRPRRIAACLSDASAASAGCLDGQTTPAPLLVAGRSDIAAQRAG